MTTTTKKENLSAFLDNESGEFEQRRLLDELQKDDELLQTMSRYTLIGDTMRNEQQPNIVIPSDFLSGIHDRLEEEPSYDDVYVEQQKEEVARAWLKPAAGFAVAASIAAVVALNFPPTISPKDSPMSITSQASIVSASSAQPLFMAKSTMKARLHRYIKSHVKHTPSSAIMPSVRSFTHANN